MTLRAAVVGCGRIGSTFADDPLLAGDIFTHAGAYARSSATELVAVCDCDPAAAAACAERWGEAAAFTDVGEMLRTAEPELVSICTPDETHYAIALEALQAPSVRGLLCEKPLATSLDEGEELVRLASERGKTIAVAYVRRYADNIRALRDFLAAGSIGAVRALNGWYTKGVLHNGTHWFDLVRILAGEVEWVEAAGRLGEGGPDPTLDVTLGLASGAVATLRGADASRFTIFEMDLLADSGRALIRESGHDIAVFRAEPSARYSGYRELAPEPHGFGDMRNLMLKAVDDLAKSLASGAPPRCTAEDGLAALRIGSAALKASAGGRRVGNSPGLPELG